MFISAVLLIIATILLHYKKGIVYAGAMIFMATIVVISNQ